MGKRREEVMFEAVLQDLKESLVSNVKSNIINLRENKKIYLLSWTREVWRLHGRLEHVSDDFLRVMFDYEGLCSTTAHLRILG